LYEGADAVGGADFILDVELFVLVVEDVLPDSYVVAPPVYPPSIAVFEPDVLLCVLPAKALV
tara:strand:+ start:328 stop:513 length:186 start_codon:yes stop_codon:yes gene_type:complete